ncbi:subtilisin-like protease SBT1.5 [Juglans microcarpa x Juglans regia]|uniref:subtilisin-like protease SBT1.5 n=1 Tax=Juglans microcarpa x Juglans regia TaxID=2249226 RepID=UPI001B7F4073|nr:subtilisin-like protease SBT1.5 [Juglans microcarpa x Juglans regia]
MASPPRTSLPPPATASSSTKYFCSSYIFPASTLCYSRGLLPAWLPKLAWPLTMFAGTQATTTLVAFDTVVADGVNFISLSVGVVFVPYYLDTIAIAAFRAYDSEVFVFASTGNDGLGALFVTNIAPWVTTIGAARACTIDKDFPADVKLGNRKIIPSVKCLWRVGFNSERERQRRRGVAVLNGLKRNGGWSENKTC